MARLLRVKEFLSEGRIETEDGKIMQAVISETGSLGARPLTDEDRLRGLDQYVSDQDAAVQPIGLPSLASLGLDQA